MQTRKAQALTAVWMTLLILVADQWIKIAVKTGMYLHQSIRVTDWFYILFTENRGMAFGMEIMDKYLLTSFRIVAVVFLAWYVARQIKKGTPWGYLICLVMVMAGAAGNIFDCLFYGMVFNNPPAPLRAEFVPWGEGYETLMQGRVGDGTAGTRKRLGRTGPAAAAAVAAAGADGAAHQGSRRTRRARQPGAPRGA